MPRTNDNPVPKHPIEITAPILSSVFLEILGSIGKIASAIAVPMPKIQGPEPGNLRATAAIIGQIARLLTAVTIIAITHKSEEQPTDCYHWLRRVLQGARRDVPLPDFEGKVSRLSTPTSASCPRAIGHSVAGKWTILETCRSLTLLAE